MPSFFDFFLSKKRALFQRYSQKKHEDSVLRYFQMYIWKITIQCYYVNRNRIQNDKKTTGCYLRKASAFQLHIHHKEFRDFLQCTLIKCCKTEIGKFKQVFSI